MSAAKSAHADSAPEDHEITISVDELIRTRTQLVTGLTSISAAINEFVRSYVQHTDKWIGKETQLPSGIDISAMSNLFGAGPSSADSLLPTSLNAVGVGAGKRGPYNKKGEKKPRKMKDPNAPKRPLTAYFLYSQYARSVVKHDFESSGVTPSAAQVSEEILRRWKNMTAEEHVPWKELYEKNAEAYRKDTEAYKAKTGAAPPEDDEEEAHAAAGAIEETPDVEAGPSSEAPVTAPAATAASATKPPKAVKGKGKKKDDAPATSAATQATERDSPSAQLISKVSAVPIPGTQPEAPAAKSTKRKSETVENKAEKPAKKKRKTKAEKEAEEAAAAKDSAKPTTAASGPAPEKKRKTKGKKDKSSD